MEIEICTIDLTRGVLDNEYTIYEKGEVKNFYDQNMYKLNITSWTHVSKLHESLRERLLEKCPEEHKDRIVEIFAQFPYKTE